MTTIEDANFALQKVLDAGSQKNVIELAWIKNVRVTIPRVIVHYHSHHLQILREIEL